MSNDPSRAAARTAFSGSYEPADVTFLLKPADIATTGVEEKEAAIQSGRRHYSEMIAPESAPDQRYMDLYEQALQRNGARLASDILLLSDMLEERAGTSRRVVLVSLARAGTPIGVLLGRELRRRGLDAPHYSVSIIRGRGIDEEAMRHVVGLHSPEDVVFVDGWTGKGAIADELAATLLEGPLAPLGVKPYLVVVADPAGRADMAATHDDYVIPSGLLNGIVSGLISRSVLNEDHVGPGDFHACLYQTHLRERDISRAFVDGLDAIMREARPSEPAWDEQSRAAARPACEALVSAVMSRAGITDRNRVKPGIAESTRAILRRVPDSVHLLDESDPDVAHIVHLARTAGIPVLPMPVDTGYRALTVIKSVGAE